MRSCIYTAAMSIALVTLNGCGFMGPAAINGSRVSYNQAIQDTSKQQLLLNIVRTRYDDPPVFFDVTQVNSQLTLTGTGSATLTMPLNGASGRTTSGTLGGTYTDQPTIQYVPLQGANFVTQMLSPINLQTLVAFYDSGWPVDDIFRLMVDRIGDNVVNSPESGVVNENFQKAMKSLRILQALGALDIIFVPGNPPATAPTAAPILVPKDTKEIQTYQPTPDTLKFQFKRNAVAPTHQADAQTAWDTLFDALQNPETAGAPATRTSGASGQNFLLLRSFHPLTEPGTPPAFTIRARSALGVISYVSLAVGGPKKFDMADGGNEIIAKQTQDIEVTIQLFPSTNAFVQVPYGNRWYIIPNPPSDDELKAGKPDPYARSRRNFALLSQLITSQATSPTNTGLLLTLPVGGH